MNFILGNKRYANLKNKSIIYNNYINTMLALQQRQNNAVVAPAPAPAPAPVPAPVPAPSTNNKLPKKGFNVILSKLNQ